MNISVLNEMGFENEYVSIKWNGFWEWIFELRYIGNDFGISISVKMKISFEIKLFKFGIFQILKWNDFKI